MKKILAVMFILSTPGLKAQPFETFHDFTHLTIVHDSLHFSDYAGMKVLVVNTASYCGYTPQLGDLVTLDSLYSGPNFAIICFPCNDFGGQEPHDDSTIQQFYLGNYHVGYQLMSKISITAPDTAEVYKWLQLQSRNGVANANVTWNFNKFCIDEAGNWVRHFPEYVNPLDTAIVNWILSPNTTGVMPADRSGDIVQPVNPAYGRIKLEIKSKANENFTVELFDLQGKSISEIFSGRVYETQKINYTPVNLESGIYFVKITSATTNRAFKVCYVN